MLAAGKTLSPFSTLSRQAPDALLGLIALHRDDTRPEKIDLGVGVYRAADGGTPVMRAIKEAERRLLAAQGSKAYLGPEGDAAFTAHLSHLVFGPDLVERGTLLGVQTPGGTGALRLGAELYARAQARSKVWVGSPTWPNHAPIFAEAGLEVVPHPFYHVQSSRIDFATMVASLENAARGDLVLLHGCCHNPTGAQFTDAQWAELGSLCSSRGVTPFIDLAYQGLGDGWEQDASGLRALISQLPAALVAYSCDKNFGLYRDRVGALWLHERSSALREAAWENMLALARSLWSMPPDHGAAVVRLVLEDPTLTRDWLAELDEMRSRLNEIRALLAGAHPALGFVADQRGMFALLPIAAEDVLSLRRDHAIYMAASGRINIAGLTPETVRRFAAALGPFLQMRETHHD